MNTSLQPKKLSLKKRSLQEREEIITKIISGKWWPFDRVEPSILNEVERRLKKLERSKHEDALL